MAEELGRRVDALIAPYFDRPFMGASVEDGEKHLRDLNNLQKDLRLIKQEIAINEREIYARYTNDRIDVRTGAVINRFVGGWLGLLFRAGTAGSRASIQRRQQQELLPYLELRNWIDQKMIQIDRAKLEIQQSIANMARLSPSKIPPTVTHNPQSLNSAPTRLSESEYFTASSRRGTDFVANLNALSSLAVSTSPGSSREDLLQEAAIYAANIRRIKAELFACTPPPRLSAIHAQHIEIARHNEKAIDYRIQAFELKLKANEYAAEGRANQDVALLNLSTALYNQCAELTNRCADELNQATDLSTSLVEQIKALVP